MGGALSSGTMTTLIQTLKQEHCPSSHPIWLEVSINDMPNQYLSEEDICNLTIIKNKQPDNFASLIRVTIEVFSQASKISDIENSQNSKYINVCNFICLLLSISNDLDNNNFNCSCWFKPSQMNVSATKPILNLMETLQRLLRFNDPVQLFLQSSILDLRISYTKTLLFLIHAKSLGGIQSESDPSQFLLTFDSFCWNRFLFELFEIIPITLSNKENDIITEKEQLLVRSLITTAIPCLYSCTNWNIQQINVNLIQSSFSILKQYNNSKVISLSEQLVTFLFIVISKHPAFLDYIFSSNQTIEYITSLLYFYQVRFFENKRSSFFHKLILIILITLTSPPRQLNSLNEPFNGHFTIHSSETVKIHRGTNADLIIEVTTNPIIFDSNSIESITSLASDVILNLSEKVAGLSFFSGNRLFLVLKKLFASGLFQKVEFENSIRNFLCSIFQMLRFNSKSNLHLFTMAAENERLLNFIVSTIKIHHEKAKIKEVSNKKSSLELASSLLKMVSEAGSALKITNQKKREEKFYELIEKVNLKFDGEPEKAEKITIESFSEIKEVWFDWLRLLFWISFPKEARKAGLTFASFELDSKGRGRDRIDGSKMNRQMKITQNQTEQKQIQKQRNKSIMNVKVEEIEQTEKSQKKETKKEEIEQMQKEEIKNEETEKIQKKEKEETQEEEIENVQKKEIKNEETRKEETQEEEIENVQKEEIKNKETEKVQEEETGKEETQEEEIEKAQKEEIEQIPEKIQQIQFDETFHTYEEEDQTLEPSKIQQNQEPDSETQPKDEEPAKTHENNQLTATKIQTETEQTPQIHHDDPEIQSKQTETMKIQKKNESQVQFNPNKQNISQIQQITEDSTINETQTESEIHQNKQPKNNDSQQQQPFPLKDQKQTEIQEQIEPEIHHSDQEEQNIHFQQQVETQKQIEFQQQQTEINEQKDQNQTLEEQKQEIKANQNKEENLIDQQQTEINEPKNQFQTSGIQKQEIKATQNKEENLIEFQQQTEINEPENQNQTLDEFQTTNQTSGIQKQEIKSTQNEEENLIEFQQQQTEIDEQNDSESKNKSIQNFQVQQQMNETKLQDQQTIQQINNENISIENKSEYEKNENKNTMFESSEEVTANYNNDNNSNKINNDENE